MTGSDYSNGTGLQPALSLLLQASQYAGESRSDRWQLAVDLDEVRSRGATLTDVRWLIRQGLAEHAKETTIPGDQERSFRELAPTAFPNDTCLVLTEKGAVEVRSLLDRAGRDRAEAILGATPEESATEKPSAPVSEVPEWDAGRRELRFGGELIKAFRVPAPNQELILTVFLELGWPAFIDDPLPPKDEIDPKQRLRTTIKALNRGRRSKLISFHGNGNGSQVYWRVAPKRVSKPR